MPALYSPCSGAAEPLAAPNAPLEVSYPGSMAPHFRVQILIAGSQQEWKLVASFSDVAVAETCLAGLRRQGEVARLVAYRRVPTAA